MIYQRLIVRDKFCSRHEHCCYIVLQPLKISSIQYRNSIADKNGPGGSGTHDPS